MGPLVFHKVLFKIRGHYRLGIAKGLSVFCGHVLSFPAQFHDLCTEI